MVSLNSFICSRNIFEIYYVDASLSFLICKMGFNQACERHGTLTDPEHLWLFPFAYSAISQTCSTLKPYVLATLTKQPTEHSENTVPRQWLSRM